ncbi:hypothetical protein T484DRAFT_1631538, partial [Baffinella frigidus]
TLNPEPWTLNPQPSTLNPQPSTLNPQPSTLNHNPGTAAAPADWTTSRSRQGHGCPASNPPPIQSEPSPLFPCINPPNPPSERENILLPTSEREA